MLPMWNFSILFWINIATFLSSGVVALLIFQRKKFPGQIAFALLMIMASEWSLATAFETAATGMNMKIFFAILVYPGAMSVSVLFFYFVMYFTLSASRFPKIMFVSLWIIPTISILSAITNNYHHLLWKSFEWHTVYNNLLIYNHGVWYYVSISYSFILLLFANYLLIKSSFQYPENYKKQAGLIIIGSFFPALTELLYALDLTPIHGWDISPLGFLLSGILIFFGIITSKLFNIIPVAREKILDIIQEGIIILDESHRILDMNPAAIVALKFKTAPIGKSLFDSIPETKILINRKSDERIEIFLKEPINSFLEFTLVELKDPTQNFSGKMITFRNISEKKNAESALMLSEEKYKVITENIEDVVWIMNMDMKLTYVSPSIKVQRGYTPEEYLQMKLEEIYTEETLANIKDVYTKNLELISQGVIPNTDDNIINANLKCKDGSIKPAEIYTRLLKTPDGKIIGVQGVTRDISKRMQDIVIQNSRLKLHQFASTQSLDNFLVSMLDEICNITGSPIGFFHYIVNNETEIELKAWSSQTTEKYCTTNSSKNNYLLKDAGIWTDSIKQRKPVIVNDYDSAVDKKGLPEGHSKLNRVLTVPVNHEDKIVAILGIGNKLSNYTFKDAELVERYAEFAWDISERKRAEESLRSSEERLRTLINSVPDIICFKDDVGRWLLANDSILKLYCLQGVDYFNKTEVELSEFTADLYKEPFKHCLESDEIAWAKSGLSLTEESIPDVNGNINVFEVYKIPIYNNDKSRKGLVVFGHNVTDKKIINQELVEAKEKAEEMNRVKSYFFANMSHELRTPMVGIMGFSEVLSSILKNEEEKQLADGIHVSSLRLMETLNLLLDFTKVEAGKIELKINEVDINKIVNETISLFEYLAVQKGLELKSEIIAENLILTSDERILLQVMNNLVNNAIKYTKKGYVKLTIDEEIKNGEEFLIIKVKDTGIGIPKEKQKVVWEEFRQVSEGISRNYEGTGLGLTITKRFVEKLKGSIEVESEINSGTTFTVSIPKNTVLDIQKNNITNSKPTSFEAEIIDINNDADILYVENEEVSRKYVGYILRNIYKVDYAGSDKEAFDKLYDKKYKLILMDINLGKGMDGIELTKEIKKNPDYANIPIIADTAYALEDDKFEFLDKGCNDYISKPFERDDLLRMINKYI